MVEDRELKMKRFLERNTSMHTIEIEQLFEYKESESDTMIRNLNSLGLKNSERAALQSMDDLSLEDSDKTKITRKRKKYDTVLVGRESDNPMGSQNREFDPYVRSKRRKEYDVRTSSSERRWY